MFASAVPLQFQWRHQSKRLRVMTVNGGSAGRTYFHVYKARPWGLLASAVGMTGLWATWLSAPPWTPLIALSLIFGSFVIVGLPAAVSGGCYRSWFARLYGRNDSCRLNDLAEFQQLGGLGAADSSEVISYRLVLRDGTVKPIQQHCFGDRDAFIRALTKENRRIVFTQLAK
jgi:hypothetical protein